MEQFRRNRASAQVLRAAFPAVQQLRIELKFAGPTAPTAQSHLLFPPARAFFEFPCPYADCDGQFDLGNAVKTALADSTRAADGMLECGGSRARDHALKQPCRLQLLYEVTATYQEQT